jgi:hypothetical protein
VARMPQIPGIDYAQRPAGRVEGAQPSNPELAAAPLAEGARAVGDFTDERQRAVDEQQRQLDQIDAARQKILDTTTATRTVGDFETQLRGQLSALQKQHADNPDKVGQEFVTAARATADDVVRNAPNTAVGLMVARQVESSINSYAKSNEDWASRRATQMAGNNLQVAVNRATRGAEDVGGPEALGAYARRQWGVLRANAENLTPNSKEFQQKLYNEIAKSWVVAVSGGANGRDPDPVRVMQALDAPKGFLVDSLTTEDRKSLRAQVQASNEGVGKAKQMRVLMENVDQAGQVYDLYRTGELNSGVAYSLQRANEQKRLSITLDPNMDEHAKQYQLKSIDQQNDMLRYLDIAQRKQSGFGANPDQKVRRELLKSYDDLFSNESSSPAKNLEAIGQFRHDLAKEYAAGNVSRADLDRMDRGLSMALPRNMANATKEMRDSWTTFSWRQPRVAGTAHLADLFDDRGVYGNATEKQKNEARLFYIEQLNTAMEQGAPITDETTRGMALKAAQFIMARRPD